MANLYIPSNACDILTDWAPFFMRFNMQWYGGNRRSEQPAFSAIEPMTYNIFSRTFSITPALLELDCTFQYRILTYKQSSHHSSCSRLVSFRWFYCDISHYPSLSLLFFFWVNLGLTCSQTDPQIHLHICHRDSPYVALEVFSTK